MSKQKCGKEDQNAGTNTQNWLENVESVNRSMLYNSVRDAGLYAYGTIGVEVWVLDESRTLLIQPSGGFWFDEAFACTACEEFHRLTKPDRPDYVSAKALAPGVGLGGSLWAEASLYSQSERFSFMFDDNDEEAQKSKNPIIPTSERALKMIKRKVQRVVWRDIAALALDPDQPINPRLELLGKAGFGLAAGVPFRTTNERGIVVYLARNTVDTIKLKNIKNEDYLLRATELIGAVWSLRGPRRDAVKQRIEERKLVKERVRSKLLKLLRTKITIEELVKNKSEKRDPDLSLISEQDVSNHSRIKTIQKNSKQWLKSNLKKSRGANVPLTPPICTSQSIFILFGTFISLIVITRFNKWIEEQTDYSFALGPFGALVTLQYSITMAPASQPRNAIIGQTVAMTVSLFIAYIDGIEKWIKQAIAPSISIAIMARLGVTHPPAGASALIFVSGEHNWGSMAMMLVANAISICLAVIINNSNEQRQYPIHWGLPTRSSLKS